MGKKNRTDRRREQGVKPVTSALPVEPHVASAATSALPVEPHVASTATRLNDGRSGSRLALIISCLSLLVAAFGGVPGLLNIKSYIDRSSVRIIFDQEESLPCFIDNPLDSTMEGKFAILLYGVKIVGKGTENFIASAVDVSIRSSGVWHEGKGFPPILREGKDPNGPTPPVVQLRVGVKKSAEVKGQGARGKLDPGDILALGEWRDFSPGIKLGFGEPATFMVATYFPSGPTDVEKFDRIRIVLRDYLGNSYAEEYETTSLKRVPFKLFLDQSPP